MQYNAETGVAAVHVHRSFGIYLAQFTTEYFKICAWTIQQGKGCNGIFISFCNSYIELAK